MNKKALKIVNILLVAVLLISISTSVFAITPASMNGSNPSNNTAGKVIEVGNNIIGILKTFGIILSVIVLIVLGIKYMMGSAEEKSEYKKTFIPYLVGAALIFAASVFAEAIYGFFTGI